MLNVCHSLAFTNLDEFLSMSIHLSQTYKPRYTVDMTLDYFGKNNMTGQTSTIILGSNIVYDNS